MFIKHLPSARHDAARVTVLELTTALLHGSCCSPRFRDEDTGSALRNLPKVIEPEND